MKIFSQSFSSAPIAASSRPPSEPSKTEPTETDRYEPSLKADASIVGMYTMMGIGMGLTFGNPVGWAFGLGGLAVAACVAHRAEHRSH